MRVRLALAIVATVVVTVGITASLSVQVSEQVLIQELTTTATETADLLASEIRQMGAPFSIPAVDERLRAIDATSGEIGRIAVVIRSGAGAIVVATFGPPPSDEGIQLGLRALQERRTLTARSDPTGIIRAASPFLAEDQTAGAVIVRTDAATILGVQRRALSSLLWFAVLSIVVIVVAVDLLARPLVYTPIRQLRDTMDRVAAGDIHTRAPTSGSDDLVDVARGLNQMLEYVGNFNDALQARVRDATTELERRNIERVESYHRLLAVREQLARAEQLASIGQTAANVAHQVGTPLNLISGHVQILQEELADAPEIVRRLTVIEEQIGKVTTTVRTLVDRSRRIGPRRRTSAGGLVRRVADAVAPNLETAHIRLDLSMPAGDVEVIVDTVNLELALLNMVNNAVHAMPDGGRLAIDISAPAAGTVRISIEDSGVGIEPDALARIFEQWFTTKPEGRGTGLGLSIARDVVESHGGSITVTSVQGQGATFTIDLPAADAASAEPS